MRTLTVCAGVALSAATLVIAAPAGAQEATPETTAGALSRMFGEGFILDLPVSIGGFFTGDVPVEIVGETPRAISGADLIRVLEPVLGEETMAALKIAAAEGGMVPVDRLAAAGLPVKFNPETIGIDIVVPADAKKLQRLGGTSGEGLLAITAAPATVSAFVNLRAFQSYDHESSSFDEPFIGVDGAARIGPVVIEAEGSYSGSLGIRREGVRAIYDMEPRAMRLVAGDIDIRSGPLQSGGGLLGVSLTRNIDLVPFDRQLRASGQRSFVLERASEIEVYSNDLLVRRLSLVPGRYVIDDLVTTLGRNDIRITITDVDGRTEEIDFTVFTDGETLGEKVLEFAIGAGVRAEQGIDDIEYATDEPLASGFMRYGLTDWLTIGAGAQADRDTRAISAEARLNSSFGVIGGKVAFSTSDDLGTGHAVSLDFQRTEQARSQVFGNRTFTLRMSYLSETFSLPGTGPLGADTALDLAAGYTQSLGGAIDADLGLSAGYRLGRGSGTDAWVAQAQLSRSIFRDARLSIGAGYENEEGRDDQVFAFLGIDWKLGARDRVSVDYGTRDDRVGAAYRHVEGSHIGARNGSVIVTSDSSGSQLFASGDYVANRARVGLSHSAGLDDRFGNISGNRTTLRGETALVYADGHVALSRPVEDGFAILYRDDSLADATILLSRGEDDIFSRSDALGPAVVPLGAYGQQRIAYDVDPLPLGYDLGAGAERVYPPYAAGYAVRIGSPDNITVLGVLRGADGEPVARRSGVMTLPGEAEVPALPFFTNADGRFVVAGLRPGVWELRISGSDTATVLTVREGDTGVRQVGDITLEENEP